MKRIISIVTGILIAISSKSQNPVNWIFSVKKIADKTFEVHFIPTVQEPWHIYSQTTPEGGALPTKISFNKNPLTKIDGQTQEVGKVISRFEEVFGVEVKYFEGKVDFVQVVKLKANAKTNLTGSIEYMACNNEQCLPPKTVSFNVSIQ